MEIKYAILIAIGAWVIVNRLYREGYILSWYYDYILIPLEERASWLAKPLGYCGECLAGQAALWLYLYKHYAGYTASNAIEHVLFILATIFFTYLLDCINKKWLRN